MLQVTEINPSWIEIQTGLYLEQNSFVVSGTTYYNSILHSAEGYCFYDVDDKFYDEEGNIVSPEDVQPNQRMYSRWLITPITDINTLNAKYISVPIEDGFEIVSVGNQSETI